MSNPQSTQKIRRKLLKLFAGGAVFVPLAMINGCSSDKDTATSAPAPAAKPKTTTTPKPKPAASAEPVIQSKSLPQLSESDPQAMALGYLDDASQVDAGKYPRFEANQACKNCALFQAKGDEEWAGCTLFPGKVVNTNGWCNAYAPKA